MSNPYPQTLHLDSYYQAKDKGGASPQNFEYPPLADRLSQYNFGAPLLPPDERPRQPTRQEGVRSHSVQLQKEESPHFRQLLAMGLNAQKIDIPNVQLKKTDQGLAFVDPKPPAPCVGIPTACPNKNPPLKKRATLNTTPSIPKASPVDEQQMRILVQTHAQTIFKELDPKKEGSIDFKAAYKGVCMLFARLKSTPPGATEFHGIITQFKAKTKGPTTRSEFVALCVLLSGY